MHYAFCLYKHFPYSGLSRDMLRIIEECHQRGHKVTIYTGSWQGPKPCGTRVKLINAHGLTNHTRNAAFHHRLKRQLNKTRYDAVVGFNKMPGLDIYYGADYCFVGRAVPRHGKMYRFTPRHYYYSKFEKTVFGTNSGTRILSLSKAEISVYQQHYGTPDERFFLLPPTLDSSRRPNVQSITPRDQLRATLGIPADAKLLLFVGSGFKTKGLDRAISATESLPEQLRLQSHLVVVGQDNVDSFLKLCKRAAIEERVHFLGGRSDIPDLLRAADLLIHPAYSENTGTVLLEAIAAGLPVLTTDVCGYAPHIERANAGVVLHSPFNQQVLNDQLSSMLLSDQHSAWKKNGLAYGSKPELYVMPHAAVDKIEDWVTSPDVARQQRHFLRNAAQLYLRSDFHQDMGTQDGFDNLMSLQGQTYRQAPGRETLRFTNNGKAYFLKRHTGVGWHEILKNISYLRAPVIGALNEWHGVHHLTRLGINTLSIAAFGIRGMNPATRHSFIITDELPANISLEDLCRRWQTSPPTDKQGIRFKRWLIAEVARIARTMHENGANHRDFYLCHFLLDSKSGISPSAVENNRLYLIDLHRVQIRRRTPTRWLIKDISGLLYSSMDFGISKNDLFRFMRTYRGKSLREILTQERSFWRRVQSRAKNLYAAEKRKAKRELASNQSHVIDAIGQRH